MKQNVTSLSRTKQNRTKFKKNETELNRVWANWNEHWVKVKLNKLKFEQKQKRHKDKMDKVQNQTA